MVCGLVALAALAGLTLGPGPGLEHDRAGREGWIHVPSGTLAELWATFPASG
ncbi:MAG: hypothetical protein M3066_08985 [Actinomycetota bacterium]|nr:hypothetical protein [Actinomycetota bacterium]